MTNLYEESIEKISKLILTHRKLAMREEQQPQKSADEMDHYISTHRNAVAILRKMREQLENLYAEKDYLEP